MSDSKIGPWSREDFESFLALDAELRPVTRNKLLSGLLGLGGGPLTDPARDWWNREQAGLVDAAWTARLAHPVYRHLVENPNFRAAMAVFERRRKAAKQGHLASANVPFLFLREFVRYAGYAYEFRGRTGSNSTKYGAHASRRRVAVSHATALRDLVSMGVGLRDYFETQNLRALLQKLCDELSKMKRKEYGGARQMQRWVLKAFASSLIVYCDLSSPAVVTHFARMVDIACETKTARRYCAEAEQRHRERLADAVLRHAAAGAPR